MMKKIIRTATIPDSLNVFLKGQLAFLNTYYQVIAVSGNGEDLEEVKNREIETNTEPQNTGQTTPQKTTGEINETTQTNLPLTGFHTVVANIAAQNSGSDTRRND